AETQEVAAMGSWEWDVARDVVVWTEQLYRIYGLHPGEVELTYQTFLQHVHPDDRAAVEAEVASAWRDRRGFGFGPRVRRPDGGVRVLQARGKVVVDSAGEPISMIGTGQDITVRVEAEEALRSFRKAVDHLQLGVTICDLAGTIVYTNEAEAAMHGYTV